MTASFAMVALAMALCACAVSQDSYGLGQGDANYDAIKAATQACQAQGGRIHLKNGYDGRELANYECKVGKGR